MAGATDPVADIVRSGDLDRYLSALYAPEAARPALLALAGFDIEAGRIRDAVSQALPGEIRLQWWREAIAGQRAAEAASNPVSAALVAAIARHRLPGDVFDAYLEARLFDLYDDPMPDRATLEGYCGETVSALVQLGAMVLDTDAASGAAEAAGHAGCALGMARLLRRLPLQRSRGQCYLPVDILAVTGLDRDAWLRGDDAAKMNAATAALAALAREHWHAFRRHAADLPASLRPAFLPAAMIPPMLDGLAADAWRSPPRPVPSIRRHWRLLRHAMRGWPAL